MITYLFSHPALLFTIIAWSMVWKGMALWKAGTERQKLWFIALFIINTFGLLEILYLFVFSKMKNNEAQE